MKKIIYFTILLLLGCIQGYSQIGINITPPTEMLDVNGKAKIRDIKTLDPHTNFSILVTDDSNVVKKISKTDLEIKKESFTVSIPGGQSTIVENTLKFDVLNVTVQSSNACGRTMIASFASNKTALAFLNGIARDIVAKVEVVPIPAGTASASAAFKLTFPNIIHCSQEGNSRNNYNLTVEKTGIYSYKITNNGDVTKTYTITFQKIY